MSISGNQIDFHKMSISRKSLNKLPKQDKINLYHFIGSIWPTGFGRVCGINPDQHFYVHISRAENFKHIDISITTVRINKSYKFGKNQIHLNFSSILLLNTNISNINCLIESEY